MQEWCEDYSGEDGCCLSCDEKEEGCLCYDCKCTKCYWYASPQECQDEKGHCEKKSKRNDWIDNYSKNIKAKRLEENKGQTELRDFENG